MWVRVRRALKPEGARPKKQLAALKRAVLTHGDRSRACDGHAVCML